MWSEGKVRIIDIANEVGVSTATVSNVIHGKTKKISAQTIKRVQEKLEERGYIPNMAATLLAQNSSRIIGVIINDHEKYEGRALTDPFIASSINYLADEIEQNDYFMMLKKTTDLLGTVKFASMWNMAGMVILGFCDHEYQELRSRIHIPFVVYDGYFENRGRICNLQLDDRDGGRQVGEYLRRLGHRKVLCVSDNQECMDQQRYEGLCSGLGFQADFMKIPMQKEMRDRYYREHFSKLCGFTAIFAVSDFYAVDLIRFLQSSGIQIPDDISIIGFDDSDLCGQVVPSLTSVRQDYKLRAQMAIRLLNQMKEQPEYTKNFTIPVKLIERNSSKGV